LHAEQPVDDQQPPVSPYGKPQEPYTFAFSKIAPTQVAGGTIKIADSTTFNVSKTIAVAEVTIEPGAMRELHVSQFSRIDQVNVGPKLPSYQWHPTKDEWSFFL
jgi:oxalate decarboxylase/phosphoglucose isomerase-like protein (cupin superfamily)